MTLIGSTAIAAALLATGCAADPGVRNGLARVGEIGPDRIEGRVRVVGSHPFSRTVIDEGQGGGSTITGPYGAEIGRLAGAQVRVTGTFEDAGTPDPSFAASSYEVISVDGEKVLLGFLERDDAGHYLRLGDGQTRIGVVPATLGGRIGTLVWVVLDENEGVARYGILREASK